MGSEREPRCIEPKMRYSECRRTGGEMADAADLGSAAERRGGSSPFPCTSEGLAARYELDSRVSPPHRPPQCGGNERPMDGPGAGAPVGSKQR